MNWSELRDQTAKLTKKLSEPKKQNQKNPPNYFTDPNWSQ